MNYLLKNVSIIAIKGLLLMHKYSMFSNYINYSIPEKRKYYFFAIHYGPEKMAV